MVNNKISQDIPEWGRILTGFLAGFLATLSFHQLTLLLLRSINVAPFTPYSMQPTSPFGTPTVFSLAFWGGVWGIIYIYTHHHFPRGGLYWLAAFLFGAVFPSLVALLVVLPLKGKPLGGGWHIPLLLTAFLINGAWGFGTGAILKLMFPRHGAIKAADSSS